MTPLSVAKSSAIQETLLSWWVLYEKFQRMLLISHPSFVKDSERQSFPEELMAHQILQKCTSVLGIQSDNEERYSSHAG